jgi:hypothetical protein
MNFEQLVNVYTGLIGSAHPLIWLWLLVDNLVGDCIGFTVPYLSETTWLLSGYLVGSHTMPVAYLLPMLIAAQVGRLGGTWLFCYLANKGRSRLFNRFPALRARLERSRFTQKLNKRHWSVPFWIALGRLFWLKFPINVFIAGNKSFRTLAAGVLISGVVFDSTYVVIGAVIGKNLTLNPIQVLPYFIIGLTSCFILTLAVRQLWKLARAKLIPVQVAKLLVRIWEASIGHPRIMRKTKKQSEAGNLSL